MSPRRLILASLTHHWRIHIAVGLGVAVATTVLAGALLVGDSMRASLRDLVIERLGRIDQVMVAPRFFGSTLAEQVSAGAGFDDYFSQARPAILLRGTIERQAEGGAAGHRVRRAGRVTVLGVGPWFWEWGQDIRPDPLPGTGQIVLNAPLAAALQARVGDAVVVRLPRPGSIPADTPLGKKSETVAGSRLTVVAVIPAKGLGRFGLRFTQQQPRTAFVATGVLQSALGQRARVNAILVAGRSVAIPAPPAADRVLADALKPRLADYGLTLRHVQRRFQSTIVIDYFQLTSDRMILSPAVERAAMRAFAEDHPQPVLTYLANDIMADEGRAKIPYSTVTGVDSTPALGPLDVDINGRPIGPVTGDQIVLNRWAAADLTRQIRSRRTGTEAGAHQRSPAPGGPNEVTLRRGDPISITYFEPETMDGRVRQAKAVFRLKAVAPLAAPGTRPCRTNDPDLTPTVPGVTDEASLRDWDPPFPYDPTRVRGTPPNDQDEVYWNKYRTTPKAFVSLATARRLWTSRFGRTTSIRIPAGNGRTVAGLRERLQQALSPAALGFAFRPLKRSGLKAASGTTSFAELFLGFSMFLIAASVMLVALLFRLGVQRRMAEVGVLLAVGISRRRTRWIVAAEGVIVAAIGGGLGMVGATVFAWAMLAGLQSPHGWLPAIGTRFLRLAVAPTSLLLGFLISVAACAVVIAWTVRGISRLPVRELLTGHAEFPVTDRHGPGRAIRYIPATLFVLALVLGLAAVRSAGDTQALAFFGSGALVLAGAVGALWNRLRSDTSQPLVQAGSWALARLAWRNGARYPGRSCLTIGLVAAASFLIVAISAFRLDPSSAGAGGFALYAEADAPIYQNLNTRQGRDDFGFSADQQRLLGGATIFSLRVRAGDDASCLNLYRPSQPRVVGVPRSMIVRGGFQWADTAAKTAAERSNPWLLLEQDHSLADDKTVVPVVLDHDTAVYSLHLSGRVGERMTLVDGRGRRVAGQVVGLLSHSIFGGDLLVAESAFLRLFPDASGYRLFLVDTPPGDAVAVAGALSARLSDHGFHAETTAARLKRFFVVQNTYLSAFQSLGALGLVLGTLGLAAVQLRNVLGRRGELALMRAAGFRRRRLAELVMLESVFLLLAGLAVGVFAALVAVLPHWLLGGASIPWFSLAAILAVVVLAGMTAGLITVRAVLRAPLLEALRGE